MKVVTCTRRSREHVEQVVDEDEVAVGVEGEGDPVPVVGPAHDEARGRAAGPRCGARVVEGATCGGVVRRRRRTRPRAAPDGQRARGEERAPADDGAGRRGRTHGG